MYRKTPWSLFVVLAIAITCLMIPFIDFEEVVKNNAIDRKFNTTHVVIEKTDTIYISVPSK